jgi:hypothetical protein
MTRIIRTNFTLLFLCSVVLLPLLVLAQADPGASKTPVQRDAQHDFDFEFGAWKAHISRRQKPLTGSTNWVEYEGRSVVRKVWNGRANLGELDVSGPAGRIEGMSLRTYNPQSRQ